MPKKPKDNLSALWDRHSGCLPVLVTVVVTIISSHFMFQLAQFWHISSAYGQAAWDDGLRVVDNKGYLSDGSELSARGRFVVYFGDYLLTVPVFFGLGLGLPYLSMRLRWERLGEQLARWRAENQRVEQKAAGDD